MQTRRGNFHVNLNHSQKGQISLKLFCFYLDTSSKSEEKPVLFYLFSLVAKPMRGLILISRRPTALGYYSCRTGLKLQRQEERRKGERVQGHSIYVHDMRYVIKQTTESDDS